MIKISKTKIEIKNLNKKYKMALLISNNITSNDPIWGKGLETFFSITKLMGIYGIDKGNVINE